MWNCVEIRSSFKSDCLKSIITGNIYIVKSLKIRQKFDQLLKWDNTSIIVFHENFIKP